MRYGLGHLDDFPFSEKEINIGSNGFDLLDGLSLVLYKEKYAMAFKCEGKTRKNVCLFGFDVKCRQTAAHHQCTQKRPIHKRAFQPFEQQFHTK